MTGDAKFARESVEQLVERFVDLALGQYEADLDGDINEYNRLFRKMADVTEELKGRSGDQRSALVSLHGHANVQVRLMAAKKTLAVAPVAARRLLEAIAESGEGPQSGDAGMSLWNLDRGVFKPT